MKNLRTITATVIAASVIGTYSSDASTQSSPDGTDGEVGQTNSSAPAADGGRRDIELPGASVFPEGVAFDESSGDIFVGSTDDGTIFRASLDDDVAQVFLAPGDDERTAVTGLAVQDDLLFVAGRDTGRVFAYDIESADLVAAFDAAAGERSLINDIAVSDDFAYVTDSFQPVLYRLGIDAGGVGEPEQWIDLSATSVPFDSTGFNLNGIAITDDGEALYTVHYGSGELFRIDIESATVDAVDLAGERLIGGDGLEIEGSTIIAIADGDLVTVELDDTGTAALTSSRQPLEDLLFPTTLALTDDSYVIVNSQLNMAGSDNQPVLPFTVSILER